MRARRHSLCETAASISPRNFFCNLKLPLGFGCEWPNYSPYSQDKASDGDKFAALAITADGAKPVPPRHSITGSTDDPRDFFATAVFWPAI